MRLAEGDDVPRRVGIDLAKMLDAAFEHLKDSTRLIVDLRGNTGGGIGGLRLMSYLTPGKVEVGYSLIRARKERGYTREKLPRFGRIPSHKATLLWLARSCRHSSSVESVIRSQDSGEQR